MIYLDSLFVNVPSGEFIGFTIFLMTMFFISNVLETLEL